MQETGSNTSLFFFYRKIEKNGEKFLLKNFLKNYSFFILNVLL